MTDTDPYDRQRSLLPPDRFTPVEVVGVGAVGRQVALQLVSAGVTDLTLVDFDTVETVNLGPQGWLAAQVGQPKVVACGESCRAINPEIKLLLRQDRFKRSDPILPIVFCCVDQMSVRRLIFEEWASKEGTFFVDGRMSGEAMRILTVTDTSSAETYRESLFEDEDAFRGACTAKATIYTSNICAGLMVAQFAKFIRGSMVISPDVTVNVLAMEMSESDTSVDTQTTERGD